MKRMKIVLLLLLLTSCSNLSLLFVDQEKLALEIKELEEVLAITESDDQQTRKAIRKYLSEHTLSPILNTRRPIVIGKDLHYVATNNDYWIVAEFQQDKANYYGAFTIRKSNAGKWGLILLYLTPCSDCLISPRLFIDTFALTCMKVTFEEVPLVLIEPSDSVYTHTWTLFQKEAIARIGVYLHPTDDGGTDVAIQLLPR
jgi:hypothetical protein